MGRLGIAVAVIVWLFYMSMIYGSAAMALAGFALIFFMIFSYVELLWLWKNSSARLDIPLAMASQNEKITINLPVETKGKLQPGKVRCLLEVRNTFSGKKKKKWFLGNAAYPYELKQAGRYEFGLKKVRIYDLTGFFYVVRKVKKCVSVDVLPEICYVPVHLTDAVRNFFGDADRYDEFRPGYDPSELFDVREFQRGDRVQNIHWKLSAKADMWMVKEHSMPKACAITILTDFSGKKSGADRNAYLKLVAGLSFSLMDQKCAHYVAWYSEEDAGIVRSRVDDEESFYLFLYRFLRAQTQQKVDVVQMYKEKCRYENLVHLLVVTMDLEIKCEDEIIGKAEKEKLSKSMGEMELVL